jgi:predicted TIM-barrel fold metal-dependent hydrolase
MVHRVQPSWRKRDRAPADTSGLADPSRPWSFEGLREAGFHTSSHGLVEWTAGGETYVKQVLPPSTVDFSYSPEALVAEMDYAGVERSLLHRTPYMGLSNDFIADCVRQYPDRLQGLAHVEEWLVRSEPDAAIEKLDRAINELGLSGLQFLTFHLDLYGRTEEWDGPGFRPFWDAAAAMNVPIFFPLTGHTLDDYLSELRTLRRWMERYPDVTVVVTHGFNWRMFAEGDSLSIPDRVFEAAPVDSPNFNVQLLFAIFLQTRWDYPMPQMRATLHKLVERIGADRLIWGTDIPIVLLHWTYRQSLDYIRDYCDFLGRKEMDLVLGGNMERLMGIGRKG